MDNPIFDILLRAEKASQIALDQQGRTPYPTLGVVVENADPQNKRRVKVVTASNPLVQSDWIRRLTPFPGFDPHLPTIGSTVLVLYVDGLPDNGYYLQVGNDTNAPLDKASALNDHYTAIPGQRKVEIGGDDTTAVEGDSTLEADNVSIMASTDFNLDADRDILMEGQRDLKLLAARYLRIQVSPTNYIELSFDGTNRVSGTWTINISGCNLNFINASSNSIKINGKAVVVVGATNSDGSTVVTSGV